MPLQNRVTPLGELIAVPERGTFTGNRGILHTPDQKIVHYNRGRRWIICQLEFRGWHREVMQPNRWTELFFLDEATALAAGHRPCAMCRHQNYQRFRRAWAIAHNCPLPSADQMDRIMHLDRLAGPRTRQTFTAYTRDLPDCVFVLLGDEPWLLTESGFVRWSPGGYDRFLARDSVKEAPVLTPRSVVETIRAGYAPLVHPSLFQRLECQMTPPSSG